MIDIYDFDRRSRVDFARARRGLRLSPSVLYFMMKEPDAFAQDGQYIDFQDFVNIQRDFGIEDVPLTTFYHQFLLYFVQRDYPRYLRAVTRQIRNNPYDRPLWNESSHTRRYWLLGSALVPYAAEKVTPEYKIEGIGSRGRAVLRAVLFDEFGEGEGSNPNDEPTDEELDFSEA